MVITSIIGIIGNCMYGLAESADSKYILLIGRMIAGIGAANSALVRPYISLVTVHEERTKYMSISTGLSMLGLLVGPALNVAFVHSNVSFGFTSFNKRTSAGLMNVIVVHRQIR